MSHTATATLSPAAPSPRPALHPSTPGKRGRRWKALLQSILAELLCWSSGFRPE
jgi:hypothetical protein